MNSNENRLTALKDRLAVHAAAQFDIRGVAFGLSRTNHPGALTGVFGIYTECRCHARVLLAALKKSLDAPSGLIAAPKIDFAISRTRPSLSALSSLYLNEVVADARADDDPEGAVKKRLFADHLRRKEQGNPALENLGELVLCDGTSWTRIYWMAVMSATTGKSDVKAPALSVAIMGYLLAKRCLESTAGGARTDPEAARRAVESVFDELQATPNGSRLSPGDLQNAVKFLFEQKSG